MHVDPTTGEVLERPQVAADRPRRMPRFEPSPTEPDALEVRLVRYAAAARLVLLIGCSLILVAALIVMLTIDPLGAFIVAGVAVGTAYKLRVRR